MTNADTKPKANIGRVSFVPYLCVPASGPAHLIGSRCKSCGETYLGRRRVCLRCSSRDQIEEIALGRKGELFTYTIVQQSAPWVKVPFVAAVVSLPEGPFVRAVLVDVEPRPEAISVGMALTMVERMVRQDKEGNEVIAYAYRPA